MRWMQGIVIWLQITVFVPSQKEFQPSPMLQAKIITKWPNVPNSPHTHYWHGLSNTHLIWVVWALMDSMFYAQYPEHTGETLELLEDALSHFYENKSIFIDLEIWDNFNIPKLHFTSQCVDLIKLYGTTDNFITEYTCHGHIGSLIFILSYLRTCDPGRI